MASKNAEQDRVKRIREGGRKRAAKIDAKANQTKPPKGRNVYQAKQAARQDVRAAKQRAGKVNDPTLSKKGKPLSSSARQAKGLAEGRRATTARNALMGKGTPIASRAIGALGRGLVLGDVVQALHGTGEGRVGNEWSIDRNPNRSNISAINKFAGDLGIVAGETVDAVNEGRFWNDLFTSNDALSQSPNVQAANAQYEENFERAMGVPKDEYIANLKAREGTAANPLPEPVMASPFTAPEDSDYMRSFGRGLDGNQTATGPRIIERNGKKVLTNLDAGALGQRVDLKTLEGRAGFDPIVPASPISVGDDGTVRANPRYGMPERPDISRRGLGERFADITGGSAPTSMEGFMVANFLQNQLRMDDSRRVGDNKSLYKADLQALPNYMNAVSKHMEQNRLNEMLPYEQAYKASAAEGNLSTALRNQAFAANAPARRQLLEAQADNYRAQIDAAVDDKVGGLSKEIKKQLWGDATDTVLKNMENTFKFGDEEVDYDQMGQQVGQVYLALLASHMQGDQMINTIPPALGEIKAQ